MGEMKKMEPIPQTSIWKWNEELDMLLAPLKQVVVREQGQNSYGVEILTQVARRDIAHLLPVLRQYDLGLQAVMSALLSAAVNSLSESLLLILQ